MIADARRHDPANCDCEPCNPGAHAEAAAEICNCLEDGLRASLERWKESCECCFSEANPGGVEGTLERSRGR